MRQESGTQLSATDYKPLDLLRVDGSTARFFGTTPPIFMSEFGSFDSVFDGSERGSSNEENGEALSKKASNGTPNLNYEEKTIYVDEEGDSPPGLDELNDALRDQWMLQDICLEYQEDEDRYYFVISLARTRKASLFDFAE